MELAMKLLSVNVTLRIGLERISFAVCPEIGQARPTVHASLMQRLSDVSNLVLQLYEALHVEEHQVRTERQLVSQLEQLQVLFDA